MYGIAWMAEFLCAEEGKGPSLKVWELTHLLSVNAEPPDLWAEAAVSDADMSWESRQMISEWKLCHLIKKMTEKQIKLYKHVVIKSTAYFLEQRLSLYLLWFKKKKEM